MGWQEQQRLEEVPKKKEAIVPTLHDSTNGSVLNWASDVDDGTIEQAKRAANLPFVPSHIALMPDAHIGMGATIGSVIPTEAAVIPSAVGVDIGCGMIAVKLDLTSQGLPDDLEPLHDAITDAVPAGVGQGHGSSGGNSLRERRYHRFTLDHPNQPMSDKNAQRAFKQFGSLGSGNHFVEVCLDENDTVWIVLHSGSRGVGNQLAQAHITEAKGLMKSHFITLEDPDLAYLVEGTPEFNEYIRDMLWAQDYAAANRDMMMDFVISEMSQFLRDNGTNSLSGLDRINCHHNFTEREHHMGRNLWITRKGAIRARTGDRGVIPGSMGTKSYIVSGLGSPSSYCSCSHGAGRRMSRTKARRELDIDTFRTSMAGKTWDADKAEKLLDEDPRSYKDIQTVMEDQKDLVTVDAVLTQILNYKGA